MQVHRITLLEPVPVPVDRAVFIEGKLEGKSVSVFSA